MLHLEPKPPKDACPSPSKQCSLASLVGGIIARQHAHARSELQRLEALAGAVDAHDVALPGVSEVLEGFAALASELRAHMTKEEAILFPYVVALETHMRLGRSPVRSPFGVLERPLKVMLAEQCQARMLLTAMRAASDGYTLPPGASGSVDSLYRGLEALEGTLDEHGRVEAEEIFPRAIALEQQALSW
jgi:regulator of cell morphogenesis and NO signaling